MNNNNPGKELYDEFINKYKLKNTPEEKKDFFNEMIEKANNINLKDYEYCFKAYIKIYENNYKKAEDYFKESLKINPNLILSYYGLGLSYYNDNDYDNAIGMYQKAIDENPNFAYADVGLGLIFFKKEDYNEAIKNFENALRKDSEFAHPYYEIGISYEYLKKYDKAIENYKEAIKKDSNFMHPYNGLGNTYRKKKEYDKAIDNYNNVIDKNSNFAHAYHGIGLVYKNRDEYDRAESYYKIAIEKNKNIPYFHTNLGFLYLQMSKYEKYEKSKGYLQKAKDYFDNAIELYKKDNDNYWLSLTENKLKEVKDELSYLNTLQEKPPSVIKNIFKEIEKNKILIKINKYEESFKKFLKNEQVQENKDNNYLEILRRWNSYTPIIADNYYISKGGGYFLKIDGCNFPH